jgi:Tfp pilus assembly protein PilV
MAPARHTRITNRRAGFTVAESLLASVVLAIAVVAVAGAIIAAQSQTAIQESSGIAVSMARELMEEICSRPFTLPDATPGWHGGVTNRSTYDTIDDYNGYSDTISAHVARSVNDSVGSFTSALPPSTVIANGQLPAPSGQLYTRKVSVSYPTTVFSATDASGDFAIVTVTVAGAGGTQITLSRLIGSTNNTR